MLSLLLSLCFSLKPVILIPGTYASTLTMAAKDVNLEWYCPKNVQRNVVWVNEKYFIPPLYNCVIQWVTNVYDAKNKKAADYPGTEFDVLDFGGLDGVKSIDSFTPFNFSVIPYYNKIIEVFEKNGYVPRRTLFGAPIDWRVGIAGQKEYFPKLKKLVEDAYQMNNNQKVVIIGHSFGAFAAHYFGASAMDQAWVTKYIDHMMLLAPSFAGSGEAAEFAWTKSVHKYITIKTKHLSKAIESMGAVHVHFPNFEINGNKAVMIGPDGVNYTARDFPDLLIKHGRITGDNIELMKLNIPYISKIPDQPLARTTIVYNSRHETPSGFKLIGDWSSEKVEPIHSGGDGVVLSDGIDEFCRRYSSSKLNCHNLNEPSNIGRHFRMILNEGIVQKIYEISQSE